MSNFPSAATDVGEFITDLDGGVFDRKLSIALSEAAAACVDNGKEGEVSIKFKLKRTDVTAGRTSQAAKWCRYYTCVSISNGLVQIVSLHLLYEVGMC